MHGYLSFQFLLHIVGAQKFADDLQPSLLVPNLLFHFLISIFLVVVVISWYWILLIWYMNHNQAIIKNTINNCWYTKTMKY